MSIIGNPLVTTNYISDSFSGDASTVAFTLSQAPASDASIAVYISGLYQIPTSAYSISGTTLTFTGAPPTGTNNITVLHLGVKSATLVPVDASVTPAMLNNANVIYWSTSNNNVGIGNVTPTSLLTVTGTAALGNTTFAGTISANGGVGTAGQVLTSGATGNAYWSTVAGFSNGQSISVSALEAVGNNIATAAGDTANILIRTNDTTAVNKGGMIGFAGVSDSGNLMFASVKGAKESTDAGYLAFSTRTASAYATERMRISSNGDVRFISTSSYNGAQAAKLQWVNENQVGVMGQIACIREQNGNAPGALAFYTSPNVDANGYTPFERLRIDSSGNVKVANSSGVIQNAAGRTILGQTGSIIQTVTNYPSSAVVYTQSVSAYAEINTAYRTSITPISDNSILILEWVGLIGGAYAGNISTMKFYDVTNSAEVGLSGLSSGSRGIGHGSFRQVDSDANDRDNIILRAVVTNSNKTARTYSIYHYSENGVTKYFNATATNNNGCSYVKWHFTIMEIAQ